MHKMHVRVQDMHKMHVCHSVLMHLHVTQDNHVTLSSSHVREFTCEKISDVIIQGNDLV